MDPTVKVWPGLGENGELGTRTIWFAMWTSTYTPIWHVNCRWDISIVHRGVYPRW
jgi:hypothetical protein